jgi:hypothetical protein
MPRSSSSGRSRNGVAFLIFSSCSFCSFSFSFFAAMWRFAAAIFESFAVGSPCATAALVSVGDAVVLASFVAVVVVVASPTTCHHCLSALAPALVCRPSH